MDENAQAERPTLTVSAWDWRQLLQASGRPLLAAAMARAILKRRWFGAKTRTILALEVVDAIEMTPDTWLLMAQLEFTSGPAEVYQVPLAFVAAGSSSDERGPAWIAVESESGQLLGTLRDAMGDVAYCRRLLELFDAKRTLAGEHGQLEFQQQDAYQDARGPREQALAARPVGAEQSNSSVIYGQRLILKAFRRVERGVNPDLEITAFLTRQGFAHTPPLCGSVLYQQAQQEPWALAMLQAFVPNRGDAWSATLEWLGSALRAASPQAAVPPVEGPLRASHRAIPPAAEDAYGGFLDRARLLGQRTAEMHLALAGDPSNPDFAPEPFTEDDRRESYARMSQEARATFHLLREHLPQLAGELRHRAEGLLSCEPSALARYVHFAGEPLAVHKIRCHGDYHLGQVLATADGDFAIIDFEGEPVRSIDERRKKQLAARDVAGMIRSLHYASCAVASVVPAEGRSLSADQLDGWARGWYDWSVAAFLAAYREAVGAVDFWPVTFDDFKRLVEVCVLDKALYELRYELNNRPDWVHLPLAALGELLG